MEFGIFKKSAEAAKRAGVNKKERRELFESSALEGTEGEFPREINPKNIEAFLRRIGKSGEDSNINPEDLVGIGAYLWSIGRKGLQERQEAPRELSASEVQLISIAIKEFERWLYSGDILEERTASNFGRKDYYSIPAFIVNQLAKVREVPAYREIIPGFDKESFREFIEEVEEFASEFMTEDNLSSLIARKEKMYEDLENAQRDQIAEARKLIPDAQKESARLAEIKERVRAGISALIESIESSLSGDGLNANERISLQRFLKYYRKAEEFQGIENIANIILEEDASLFKVVRTLVEKKDKQDHEDRELNEIEAMRHGRRVADQESDISPDSSKGLDRLAESLEVSASDDSAPTTEKPTQTIRGFAGLAGLKESLEEKEFSRLASLIVKPRYSREAREIKGLADAIDQRRTAELKVSDVAQKNRMALTQLEQEINSLHRLQKDKSAVLDAFKLSAESIKRSIESQTSPADLYFLKTLLIALETRRRNGTKNFDPSRDYREAHPGSMPTFDFDEAGWGSDNYDKVHYQPAHIPFCEFTVEYLRSKQK